MATRTLHLDSPNMVVSAPSSILSSASAAAPPCARRLADAIPPHVQMPFQQFPSRRSVVYSTKGMIACSQPLAAEAGLEILRLGGNAADAAVSPACRS